MMNVEIRNRVKSLSEKIAEELVFAQVGTDNGLLPVNSLLIQIEEELSSEKLAVVLDTGFKIARRSVDEIFDTTGNFSEAVLGRLRAWIEWWQEAFEASEESGVEIKLPALLEEQNGKSSAPVVPKSAVQSSPSPVIHKSLDEPTLILKLDEDRDLIAEFVNEGQEHLTNIEQGVLVLENNPQDADILNSIFRAFHTFKGGSGFLNLTAIQTVAHELESLLDNARQGIIVINKEISNVILEGGDTLRKFNEEISAQLGGNKPHAPIVVPTLVLIEKIHALLGDNVKKEWKQSGAQTVSTPASQPVPAANTTVVPIQIQAEVPVATVAQAPTSIPEVASKAVIPETAAGSGAQASKGAGASVKVDTLKLDSLVDLVGEMVIAQSLVAQSKDLASVQSERLTRDLAQLGRISKDLQRTAMSMRMVPVRNTFQKMNRVIRDLAAKVGKEVELVVEGEDTELDRTIVEEISDPLVHMIRNSVDHGIEKPDVRIQRGKPAKGTIKLRAFHQGANIVLEIKDDGNGLNRERILAKAMEKGLVKEGQQISDADIYGLIMAAGFSTAEKVTDISGRGVGMDVVKRNIEKLHGKIDIKSVSGEGSTFSIYLPLTLAIIDGLLVGIGEQRYIIPTLSVCESFRPTADMISTLSGRGEMITVRGRLRPLLRLYDQFGIKPASTDPSKGIVVVVEAGTEARCVMVDQLLGKQEVVIKSLGETFRKNQFVSGAAILGDGRVGLILDPQALVYLETPAMEVAA
jgi:two-component system chemotaxis sensor kinase CheA